MTNRERPLNYKVKAGFDEEHAIYYVVSSHIPGLNVEAASFEELVAVTKDAFSDLVETHKDPSMISFQREVELTG